ncbi:MAG: FAD-dependent oxidoreductase [Pseudomonadota bacterium]
MDRRTLLKGLLAGAPLVGVSALRGATRLRVVVAGAGIVGASAAYHLARAGAAVTVIDQVGPATRASRGTFAWINATWAKQPRHYHGLSQQAVEDWHALQGVLKLPIRWEGSIEWFATAERQARLAADIEEQIAWGEPARMVEAADLAALEPALRAYPSAVAFSPRDGAVDPVLATQRLLAAAVESGAQVHYPRRLLGVAMAGDRLQSVETSAGQIPADRLVLATGAAGELTEAVSGVAVPQRSTPGVIAFTPPMAPVVRRVVAAPGVHLHQRDDGRVVLGEQDGAPDTARHAQRLAGRPNDFPSTFLARQHGQRMLATAARFIPALGEAKIESAVIGWRPLPLDGHPVLGRSPRRADVYVAVMHSGVTLAPLAGRVIAEELVGEQALASLAPYRPGRPFERVKRY